MLIKKIVTIKNIVKKINTKIYYYAHYDYKKKIPYLSFSLKVFFHYRKIKKKKTARKKMHTLMVSESGFESH